MITKLACMFNPTDAMIENYFSGTKKHLGDVFKFIDKIYALDNAKYAALPIRKLLYDLSKNMEPEFKAYTLLMWKDEHPEFKLSSEMEDFVKRGIFHHWKNNRHHPEFHDGSLKLSNVVGLDDDIPPNKVVNATDMTDLDLAEMVADWCALAGDNNMTPDTWAKNHIGKHFKFTPDQVNTIYSLIKKIA